MPIPVPVDDLPQEPARKSMLARAMEYISPRAEALGRGAVQGGTMGFGDELQGATRGGAERALYEQGGPDSGVFADSANQNTEAEYKRIRDEARSKNEASRKAHGGYYLGGQVAGGMIPMAATGVSLPAALAQGSAEGLGYSNADTAGGLAGDTAFGAGLGAAGYGVGKVLSKAASKVAGFSGRRVASAEAKAAAKAAEEELALQASRVGSYGGLRQTENNAIRQLLAQEASGLISPQNQALLDAMKASGHFKDAINDALTNNLKFLATRTPAVQAAKDAMQVGQAALPQAIASKAEQLVSPEEAKRTLLTYAKRYWLPLAGTAAGSAVAGPWGGLAGAMIGGRSRPAMRAFINRVESPAWQKAIFETTKDVAEGSIEPTMRMAAGVAPMLGISAASMQERLVPKDDLPEESR
jgi:hypothetical protein